MKQEHKLRRALREHYDNQQAPYSDNEWERASAMLRAERRKRSIRPSLLALGVLLTTIISVIVHFSLTDSKEISFIPKQITKAISAEASASNHSAMSEQQIRNTDNFAINKKSGQSFPEQISKAEAITSTPVVSGSRNEATLIPKINIPEPIPIEQNKEAPVMVIDRQAPVTPVASFSSNSNDPIDNDFKGQAGTVKNANGIQYSVKPDSEYPDQQAKTAPADQENSLSPIGATDAATKSEEESAPVNTKTCNIAKEGEAAASGSFQSILIKDTESLNKNTIKDTIPASITQLAAEGIYYELGVAWFCGWKGPVHRDASGFSPLAGINYMNRLNRRCALSFGLQYLQVPNLSNSSKTSRVSSYVYGEESSVTVITPSTVRYVLAPFRFHYYLNLKNSFSAGVNLAYLLDVESAVTTYNERPGSTNNYKTTKLGGYTQGFSWYDSQLAFGYRRRLWHSLSLQAEVFIGLTDVKQDEFFGIKNKERNSGAKLSLTYDMFRKNDR